MAYHVFVAMPYGTKDGINFDAVYETLIKPALAGAGFEVFRADEERRAGNIRTDMFQELLLADLVVVDLSIDNPNVWYELGVRHALRARGVVQIQCRRDYLPFDVYVDRALRYRVTDGAPDPTYLEADRQALRDFATATVESWYARRISPVYHLLTFLQEPDWKSLRVNEAHEMWEVHEAWERRVDIARKRNRPGDVLTLSEEAPTRVLRLEAYRTAAQALRSLGQFAFGLGQIEKALEVDPKDRDSRLEKGILLARLKKHDEAKVWLEAVLKDHPDHAEGWATLGRIEKDVWVAAWRKEGGTAVARRREAARAEGLLRAAIEPYATGFRRDPRHFYSGINALTLKHVLRALTKESAEGARERQAMEGGVRWAVQSALAEQPKDYWTRVTLGDLEVLVGERKAIERAYRDAVAAADKDWFALDSSRQQLVLLQELGLRPEAVRVALGIVDRALRDLHPPDRWMPRTVFLFSGHMIDRADRAEPRFPADKEPVARTAITAKLDELGAGPQDLALCGGACGGDLIFAEACLERGLRLELRIPFAVPAFLQESVSFAGDQWRDRFYAAKDHANTQLLVMPEELGSTPPAANPFTRNNLWQLDSALAWGPEKVRFICLWNRREGSGPGGTQHMHDTVLKYSGQVHVLDTNKLW